MIDGDDVTCGAGAQTRDVICVADGDVTIAEVQDELCLNGENHLILHLTVSGELCTCT